MNGEEHLHDTNGITEDDLIECANLARSGLARKSNSTEGSDLGQSEQLPVSEDILITNAVLVKSVSIKTGSSATVHSETTDGSVEDDVFEHQNSMKAKSSNLRKRTVSDMTNNNIPNVKVTDTDGTVTETTYDKSLPEVLIQELNQTLQNKQENFVPRLNFGDMEDQIAGCRTPVNSEEDPTNNHQTETVNHHGSSDKLDAQKSHAKMTGENKSQLQSHIDEPSDDDFDELIVDIANAMSSSEFETAKTALQGLDCMTEQDLIQCTSPLTYLNHLRKYGLVSRDNLGHLQTILSLIHQPEIHQKAMLYSRHKFDVVFFYPTRELIPPAYEIAKCHVMGRDFTRLKRAELETIRTGVANLLFISSHSVYIVGIEPGFSVIVTLMLHKRYIGWFQDILSDNISQIAKFGIDAVQIRGRTYTLDEDTQVGGHDTEYNTHAFLSVFNQLKDKNKQLEEKDEEIAQLSQETEFMQLELDTMSAELEVLTDRAIQQSVILRKPPKKERRFKRHERSFSEPLPEVPKKFREFPPYFWDVWVKPTTTSGYEVDRSLQNLADNIKTLENGRPETPVVDLDVSSAEFKDKDTLMQEIEQILRDLGAKQM